MILKDEGYGTIMSLTALFFLGQLITYQFLIWKWQEDFLQDILTTQNCYRALIKKISPFMREVENLIKRDPRAHRLGKALVPLRALQEDVKAYSNCDLKQIALFLQQLERDLSPLGQQLDQLNWKLTLLGRNIYEKNKIFSISKEFTFSRSFQYLKSPKANQKFIAKE